VNGRWVDKPGYLAAGDRSTAYTTWQTGWGGGLATTLPLIAAGSKTSRERAFATTAFALVHWLDELIFLSETRKRIYSDFLILSATERHMVAEVRGWPATRVRTQVKAATFHGLSVVDGPGGCSAEVVLDV